MLHLFVLFPHQASVTVLMPALSHYFFSKHIHVRINKIVSVTFYSNVMLLRSNWQVSDVLLDLIHIILNWQNSLWIQTHLIYRQTFCSNVEMYLLNISSTSTVNDP